MPDPLLGYRTSTSPAPLQASSPGSPALGRINLTVTAGAQDVYCDRIQIAVPADGTAGGAWFTEQPNFSSSKGTWTLASLVQVSAQDLGLAQGGTFHRATFHTLDEEYDLFRDPVEFGLSGPLSVTTGPLAYYIQEYSGTTSDRDEYTHKQRVLSLTVAEPVFYLHNFLARGAADSSAPRTKFPGGTPAYLSWESNGGFFRLYDGDGTLVHEGPETFYQVAAGALTMDTTYTLVASMSPETGGSGFEPIYQYATLTLTVTDPVLQGLSVRNDINALSGVDVSGKLSVSGESSLTGNTTLGSRLDVAGALTAESSLTVGRDLTVDGSTTAEGTLSVAGNLTADSDLTVNGGLVANGHLTAVSDQYVRIRELRGPYGEPLSINSSVKVLAECWVTIAEGLDVAKDIKRGGHGVLADSDKIGLWNTHYSGYLYASTFVKDNRREPYVWEPGNRVVESHWQVSRD